MHFHTGRNWSLISNQILLRDTCKIKCFHVLFTFAVTCTRLMTVKLFRFLSASECVAGSFTVSCFLSLSVTPVFLVLPLWNKFPTCEQSCHTFFFNFCTKLLGILKHYLYFPSFFHNTSCLFLQHKYTNLSVWSLSLHSVSVYPGERAPDRAQHCFVCLCGPSLWLLHLRKPPRCPGHLEVQVVLQGPCAGVLLHR